MSADNAVLAGQAHLECSDCRVAVVPSLGLGDSLIYVLIASNLARAGFRVTMVSNHLAHLAGWLPQLEIIPFPDSGAAQSLHEFYDVVISDCGGIIANLPQTPEWLARHFVFVGTLRVDPAYVANHVERITASSGLQKARVLQKIASCAGRLRVLDDDSVTMVEQAVAFCRTKLGLPEASAQIGFSVPAQLSPRRHSNRVVLHATSYNKKKNWSHNKYLSLARRLKSLGYEPEFVLSPKERAQWAPLFEEEFPVPFLADAEELAAYLYESGYVIGNDSGIGHLASAMGVPVLTIYRKTRDGFCWRPGWGDNLVVRPGFSIGAAKRFWSWFLSVRRVERAFLALVSRTGVNK